MHSIKFFLVYPSARMWGIRPLELYPSCGILGVPNIPQNLQFQNTPVLYRYNEKGIIYLYRYRPALVISNHRSHLGRLTNKPARIYAVYPANAASLWVCFNKSVGPLYNVPCKYCTFFWLMSTNHVTSVQFTFVAIGLQTQEAIASRSSHDSPPWPRLWQLYHHWLTSPCTES
jgi:hypothetical protein